MEVFGVMVPTGPWDIVSYLAVLTVTVAVFWEKHGVTLFIAGGLALALYAWFFLEDVLFTTLQSLCVLSGLLQITKVKKDTAVFFLGMVTLISIFVLFKIGAVQSFVSALGIGGLMGIIFGIIVFPKSTSFWLMAGGCVLLVGYAYMFGAWVFVVLNIVFLFANAYKLFVAKKGV